MFETLIRGSLISILIPVLSMCTHADFGREAYQSFIHKTSRTHPVGDAKRGEIEIVTDQAKIIQAEERRFQAFLSQGFDQDLAREWSRVGIVAQDRFWIWVRDAVETDHGTSTYGRLVMRSELESRDTGGHRPSAGAAVLITDNRNRVYLNMNYRHATRAWELELPRGFRDPGETIDVAAKREVREELGLVLQDVVNLGSVASDTGITSGIVELLHAKVTSAGSTHIEPTEAIRLHSMDMKELHRAILNGELTIEKRNVYVRDPFLHAALLKMALNAKEE